MHIHRLDLTLIQVFCKHFKTHHHIKWAWAAWRQSRISVGQWCHDDDDDGDGGGDDDDGGGGGGGGGDDDDDEDDFI